MAFVGLVQSRSALLSVRRASLKSIRTSWLQPQVDTLTVKRFLGFVAYQTFKAQIGAHIFTKLRSCGVKKEDPSWYASPSDVSVETAH